METTYSLFLGAIGGLTTPVLLRSSATVVSRITDAARGGFQVLMKAQGHLGERLSVFRHLLLNILARDGARGRSQRALSLA